MKLTINKTWLTALGSIALFAIALISFACQPTFVEDFGSAIKDSRANATLSSSPTPETTPPITMVAPVGELNAEQAMSMLYPGYDKVTQRASWEPLPAERKQLGLTSNIKMLTTRALVALPFTQSDRERFFLLTRTQPEACRGCQSVLGGALYEKSDAGWQLLQENKSIVHFAAADQFLHGKVVKIGVDQSAVLYRWRTTNNGYTEEGERLVAGDQTGLREIFSAITAANNEADCTPSYRCWSYKSTLTFAPREGASNYEMRVVTSGTKPDDEGMASAFEEVKTYRIVKGRYSLFVR